MRLALEKGEIDLAFKSLNPSDISDLRRPEDQHLQIARSLHPLSHLQLAERVQGQEPPPGGLRPHRQARDQPEGLPRPERARSIR